jgi:hypothetical protein
MKKPSAYIVWLLRINVLCLSVFAGVVRAQNVVTSEAAVAEDFKIASLYFIDIPNNHYIRVNLSNPFDTSFTGSELAIPNVTLKFLPSGITIPANEIASISTVPFTGDQEIEITLTLPAVTKPAPNDKQVQVTFLSFHFVKNKARSNLTGTGALYDPNNVNDLVDKTYKALQDAVASAKTPGESPFSSSFNIVVPSDKNQKTQGAGDIIINRTLSTIPIGQSFFDQINFGLKINKATEQKTDARHFELGLQFRKTFLLHQDKIRALRDALNAPQTAPEKLNSVQNSVTLKNKNTTNDPLLIINDLQKDFFRSFYFDNGLKFEGDVKGFSVGNVSNLLYEAQLQLTTVSKGIGKQAGFWNFRWIPIGIETGYNLKNDDDKINEKHSLMRVKTGAVLSLFYKATEPNSFLNRVEFDTEAVNRFLLQRESLFDDKTKKANLISKGSKYWVQSDLKFMFGPTTPMGMVGIKVGFRRGSLPPVYAFNKAFNIGLVFESANKDTSKEIKLK